MHKTTPNAPALGHAGGRTAGWRRIKAQRLRRLRGPGDRVHSPDNNNVCSSSAIQRHSTLASRKQEVRLRACILQQGAIRRAAFTEM